MGYLEKMLSNIGISDADMPRALNNMGDFSNQVRMIESDNDKTRVPYKKDGTLASSARGVYQFTRDSVSTGRQRMKNMGNMIGGLWEDGFIDSVQDDPQEWDDNTADSMFFSNLFSAPGTNSNLRDVALGSHTARQDLYTDIHHTDADEATNNRMLKFIPNLMKKVDGLFSRNTRLSSAFPRGPVAKNHRSATVSVDGETRALTGSEVDR